MILWRHASKSTGGAGWLLYQGRFKSFPIQEDHHLLCVLRYVEANAVRAGLVQTAADWPWCSLATRTAAGEALEQRQLLSTIAIAGDANANSWYIRLNPDAQNHPDSVQI